MATKAGENVSTSDVSNMAVTDPDSFAAEVEDALQSLLFYKASIVMWKCCPPVIILLGTFGNVMTIVIIKRMSEGQSSNSMFLYFTALALSDLIILYAGLLRKWVEYFFGQDFRVLHHAICKLQVFLVYSCGMISSWLLVSMTAQRVMSIVWPHYRSLSCTPRKVGAVIAIIVALATSVNSFILYLYALVPKPNSTEVFCGSIDNSHLQYFDQYIYPFIDMFVTSLVPFSILIVGNSVLVWKVIQSVQVARVMTAGGCDQVNSRQKKASSLTLTLITVSLVFLLLTMPICLYIIVDPFFRQGNATSDSAMDLAMAVCNLLWYTSSAVNFYLYILSGSRFRREFMSLFCQRSDPHMTSATTVYTMSISEHASNTHNDGEDFQMKSDF